MGEFLEKQLSLRINQICYLLEHDNYLTEERREHIKKELNKLLEQRHILRATLKEREE